MTTQFYPGGTEQPVVAVRLLVDQTEATPAYFRRVPFTIPREQEYFWRFEWQQAERETLATLEAGEGIVFDSDDPEDIVRWLHTPDDANADQD